MSCLSGLPQILLSFPTRRSSDLGVYPYGGEPVHPNRTRPLDDLRLGRLAMVEMAVGVDHSSCSMRGKSGASSRSDRHRSEEHTSELQSRQYLVCRLLLEKKKTKQ